MMKLSLLKEFKGARDIFESEDSYFVSYEYGIVRYDRKTGEQISVSYDFFDANHINALIDSRYLLLTHENLGYCVIDTETMKDCFTFSALDEGTGVVSDLTRSFDGKSLLIPMPKDEYYNPRSIFAEEGGTKEYGIAEYSIPDFGLKRIIDDEGKNFDYLFWVDFLNGYICITTKLECYFYDGNTFALEYEVQPKMPLAIVDNRHRRFYFVSDFGVKEFDENFRETDSIQLVKDVTGKLSSEFFQENKLTALFASQMEGRTFRKDNIVSVSLLMDKYLVCHSAEALGGFSHIIFYDIQSKEILLDQKFAMPIKKMSVTDLGKIVITGIQGTYLMEVMENE